MNYEQNNSIKFWAEDDRPREKLKLKGKQVLSDAELLAILMGSGLPGLSAVEMSRKLLQEFEGSLDLLGKQSIDRLMKSRGIGEAKAIVLIAALELGARRRVHHLSEEKITSSNQVYERMRGVLSSLNHEEFWVLALNRANKVLWQKQVSKGGITGTVADPRIIFKLALEASACSLILCHNHPSGNLKPSQADIQLTRKMKASGELLEIPILDHLIVSEEGYYSFADEGSL